MNTWRLIAANEWKETEPSEDAPAADEAKIKIFNVMLDALDLDVAAGRIPAALPVVPGRFAVGTVLSAAEEDGEIRKGARVFIDPVFRDEAFEGDSTPLMGMDSVRYAGQTANGFASPFAVVPKKNLYVLPDSVSDENACFTYLLALAESALDKLGEITGKYIAVVGANTLGILLCLLLAYYQAVPILIDGRTARLDFARKCGITYAFLNDDNLDANVNDITGAAFADGAVYVSAGKTIVGSSVFRVTAPRKNVVFVGYAPGSMQIDLELVFRKELHVIGVHDGSDNISTAINLLATRAVDVSVFSCRTYSLDQLPKAYTDGEAERGKVERPAVIDCYGKL